jgi:predicted outer membrane repeat protein
VVVYTGVVVVANSTVLVARAIVLVSYFSVWSPNIIGNLFQNNSAYRGGAIRTNSPNVVMTDNMFIGNTAAGPCGAAALFGSNSLVLRNNFTGNVAYTTGGALCTHGSTIRDNYFVNNVGAGIGGQFGALYNDDNPLNISSCLFMNNSASFTVGAIGNYGTASTIIQDSIFIGNSGPTAAAVYSSRNTNITNCIFTDNYGKNSYAAVYINELAGVAGYVSIKSCTFARNVATGTGSSGALNINTLGNADIYDSIFTGNTGAVSGSINRATSGNTGVYNCTFTNGYGGSGTLYSSSYSHNWDIYDSVFQGNRGTNTNNNGGAIYSTGVTSVTSSIFRNNSIPSNGGCISSGDS